MNNNLVQDRAFWLTMYNAKMQQLRGLTAEIRLMQQLLGLDRARKPQTPAPRPEAKPLELDGEWS